MRRPCLEHGCPETQAQSRCAKHRREREQARGTSGQRGYTYAHQQLRAHYQQRMDDGETFTCPRCPRTVDPTNWDLGHTDDRTAYTGPECASCNRRAPHLKN